MELQGIAGGIDEALSASSAPASRPASFPPEIARVLSYLANLIDASIQVRGVGGDVRDFAAAFLRVPATDVVATSCDLGSMSFQLAGLAFGDDVAAHPPVAVIGEDQETPPHWEVLDLGELRVPVPFSLAAAFRPGEIAARPLIVAFDRDYNGKFTVTIYSRATDAPEARAYLEDLLARSRARTNPFKARALETVNHPHFGLTFKVVTVATRREEVVLPAEVWEEVDRNVHGFFAAFERLRAAGLARNRGILLEGPPGTGKTALCRALAGELSGTTVVFCDAASVVRSVRTLYRELEHLSPALVVMEDIDLVVGHRQGGSGEALMDFLLALDGALSDHEGVVTIATTNDVNAIDEAAKRAARFDRVVSVPPPDRQARAAILARYLRAVDAVAVDEIAAATEGLTGADLRELVSLAVIHAAEEARRGGSDKVTTELLVRLARQRQRPARFGQYL